MMSWNGAYLLETRQVEKVWGRSDLPAPFTAPAGKNIGEIWFEPTADNAELLVKYLFTSEKLSVQVHPSDDQAPPGSRGKAECWYVLDAEPEAKLAIGLREPVDAETLRTAAHDGSIEGLLQWHDVAPGDFFYLPTGTVHAIGPGISLLEVQQNSDITYRLYDYGRPRDLHLDDGLRVATCEPYDPANACTPSPTGSARLVEGPHFRMIKTGGAAGSEVLRDFAKGALVIPLEGCARIGSLAVAAGQCGWAPQIGVVDLTESESTMIVASC